MKSRTISHVTLMFNPDEQNTADLIGGACEKAIQLAQEIWGLGPPENCRIYVMTSWWGFVFQSAPWPWRILLGGNDTVLVLPCPENVAVQRRLDPTVWQASGNRGNAPTFVGAE